ncbi:MULTISPECIES: hypothetical protein [Pseudomonas]|jgi:hypothetical protein|uniref:HEAT repeat domain-containing protein n=1 Tax=Pseudomonas salomonii TaxID=191391 RepID=A0ABS9GS51_9PSED|nr:MULTISPECIES: hypothetical protein [Pseudomonas]KQM51907.1 hypothetical protein ASE80_27425 [Pseudomonas sp. Leaf15]MCF5547276.1 HEAT repeat domain-containing protein [Pseudomonas salomonii]MDQ0704592.1 hypothetical protein [Pseudomonas sp. W3I7]RAH01434.1 hypothetical protein DJ480_17595 [Pseudomonas sp. Leaf98]
MFKEYELFLHSCGSEDYWSDEGIDVAGAQVSEFTASDWYELESAIGVKPDVWLGRCAESLTDCNDVHALQILLRLLEAKEESVVIHALESIDALFLAGYIRNVSPVITALNERVDAYTRTLELMVATLIRKLK